MGIVAVVVEGCGSDSRMEGLRVIAGEWGWSTSFLLRFRTSWFDTVAAFNPAIVDLSLSYLS